MRSPKASEGQGGALGEAEALKRGNTVGVRDQIMDLVSSQGLKVTRQVQNDIPVIQVFDTPDTMPDMPNSGSNRKGQIAGLGNQAKSLVEDSLLPTPKARDSQAEGYEAGLRRATPQVGTIVKGIVEKDSRIVGDVELFPTPAARDYKDGTENRVRNGVVQTDSIAREVFSGNEIQLLPTPTVSDTYTDNLKSSQQKDGSLHSVTLPQAIRKINNGTL